MHSETLFIALLWLTKRQKQPCLENKADDHFEENNGDKKEIAAIRQRHFSVARVSVKLILHTLYYN